MSMRIRTKHSQSELLVRSKLALADKDLIEIVEANSFPSGAQKTAIMLGFQKSVAYSVWALAALKRDYPSDYKNLKEIQNYRHSN